MSSQTCPHLCQFWVIKKSKEFGHSSRRWLQRCKHDWLIAVYFDLDHQRVSKHWYDPMGNLVAKTGNLISQIEREWNEAKEIDGEMTRQTSQKNENYPTPDRIFDSGSDRNV
jgi:hypothetical protein